jgi:hypothetical protein
MSVFPKTRAAAGYIASSSPGELARARATILLARLGACEDILPGDGNVPAALPGLPAAGTASSSTWSESSPGPVIGPCASLRSRVDEGRQRCVANH